MASLLPPALLPPPGDRAWIVDELARLVAFGAERTMIRAPLRFADDFDGRWEGGPVSLHHMVRDLMRYGGLGALAARLEPVEASLTPPLQFVGFELGALQYRFTLNDPGFAAEAPPPLSLVAREVARAWCAVHGLDEQPRRIDLCAVALGFGPLLSSASLAGHRGLVGGPHPPAGLPPEHLAFALAAQVLARRPGCLDLWRWMRRLPPALRPAARAALRDLRPSRAVRRRLGLALLEDPPPVDLFPVDSPPVGRS